jgi:hypothetical protein
MAWLSWIVAFGYRVFHLPDKKLYRDEDRYYEERKLSSYYRALNLFISTFYISYLFSIFFFSSIILR